MDESTKKNIKLDTDDRESLVALMDELGSETDTFYSGANESGETLHISIFPDKINVLVFQDNGWLRRSVYHRDGTSEEIYEGRWEQ